MPAIPNAAWRTKVEDATKQNLSIETSLNEANLTKCHHQSQSPLYRLPKEIRDLIFLYASTQSPDAEHKYGENAFYYRPDHTARLRTHAAFLLTCRRVWLEANALPMRQAEHTFWFQRGPYDTESDKRWIWNVRREKNRFDSLISSLTKLNLSNLTYIHFFMQMFQAEGFLRSNILDNYFPQAQILRGLSLKVFHVTLRHSDWFDWEIERPLHLDEKWVQALLTDGPSDLFEEFRLELEVWDRKKSQLEPIIERLKLLESQMKLDKTSSSTASKLVFQEPSETWEWSRSPRVNGQAWPVYQDIEVLNLYAFILKWRNKQVEWNEPPAATSSSSSGSTLFFPRPTQSLRGFSQARMANYVETTSVAKAETMQRLRREAFERLMGELEAKKLVELWRAQGSLLRLEPDQTAMDSSSGSRPDLSWLSKFKV